MDGGKEVEEQFFAFLCIRKREKANLKKNKAQLNALQANIDGLSSNFIERVFSTGNYNGSTTEKTEMARNPNSRTRNTAYFR